MSIDEERSQVKIGEMQPYQSRFDVLFQVVEKSEEREVKNKNNPDETHRVCDITVADETGSIILTAWDDDIDLLQKDTVMLLNNGYINVFRGSMRLSRGKFGTFEKSESGVEVNLNNNRSEEVHEQRERKRPNNFNRNRRSNYNNNNSYSRW